MFRLLALLAVSSLALAFGTSTNDARAEDRERVERAALDYVEAFYEGKPELLDRSMDPKIDKIGFHLDRETMEYTFKTMTFEQAKALAKDLKTEGYVPEGATHRIEILDLMDRTAAVKLEAIWGVDYMHLIKEKDTWKIRHVLWQSVPSKGADEDR